MREIFPPIILNRGVHAPDGTMLAAPLGPGQAAAMGCIPEQQTSVPVFVAGEVTSTFDLAWELARTRAMEPWTTVIARSQTFGRGQMRRAWHSPPGNLYCSFFLPRDFERLENLSALATGYCIHAALAEMGVRTLLKWPNDLLLRHDTGEEGKFGGLLLEERNGLILAGLGLNLCHAPDEALLRRGSAVPASALPDFTGGVLAFCLDLIPRIRDVYTRDIASLTPETVRATIETSLAWKEREVRAEEGGAKGRIAGLALDGSLLLRTAAGIVPVSSGGITPV